MLTIAIFDIIFLSNPNPVLIWNLLFSAIVMFGRSLGIDLKPYHYLHVDYQVSKSLRWY